MIDDIDHQEPEPEPETAAAIAIVGLAARFPGAADAATYWRNLSQGIESIARMSDGELAAAGVAASDLADPRYVRAKGALADADLFDAAFFGITPREAEVLDPQHRVFLETAWEALEDAGCDPRRGGERVGLWAGAGAATYLAANLFAERRRLEAIGSFQTLLLNDRDFLATRAAHALDLRGPSVTVQTACSTSLVAVHLACQSLLAGECDVALAGGVSISSPLRIGYFYEEGGVMSPDGRCRAFDAAAAGAVEGNGCGVVALMRLADATAAGARILAVLCGSAVNNDGASRPGFTAPSVEGQAQVITESLLMAGVDPRTIRYVEAHGSGTPLGDPIEVAALTQAFRTAAGVGVELPPASCALGSVKTAIGHCNTAAGIAGLIKTVLALTHRTLPPSLHFQTPNPRLELAAGPFYVPVAAAPWPAGDQPRRAGVSSFGLGGTNAHVILEEAPPPPPADPPARQPQLLVLSARTPAALSAAAARLAERLGTDGEEVVGTAGAGKAAGTVTGEEDDAGARLDRGGDQEIGAAGGGSEARAVTGGERQAAAHLADVAWTLQTGRRLFEHRRFVVVRDREQARAALAAAPAPGSTGRREGGRRRQVVFLFPGLGDQYPGMARGLYDAEPVFRQELDRCARLLAPALAAAGAAEDQAADLLEVLFAAAAPPSAGGGNGAAPAPRPAGGDAGAMAADPPVAAASRTGGALLRPRRGAAAAGAGSAADDPAAARLARTRFAQPACFAVEYALAKLLMSWGIEPQALIGYSVGELVAACIGGSLTLEEALDLVAERALRIDELPGGAMLAVPLPEHQVLPLLAPPDGAAPGAGGSLALAATNGQHFSVVAGDETAVADLERRLAAAGTTCLRLRTTHAFHSPAMAPAAARLRAPHRWPMRPPRIPWISNVTGGWVGAADLDDPGYWARHVTGTVRFAEGLSELLAEPDRLFVEVGPGSTLSTLVAQHPAATAATVAVPTLRRADETGDDLERLLAAAGRLWIEGVPIDWQRFHAAAGRPARRRRVALPTYPFERQRYWVDPPRPGQAAALGEPGGGLTAASPGGATGSASGLAATRAADLADWIWVTTWKRLPLPPADQRASTDGVPAVASGMPAPPGLTGAFLAAAEGRLAASPSTAASPAAAVEMAAGPGSTQGMATEPPAVGATAAAERWLIFADAGGLGERVASRLRATGRQVATAVAGAGFAALGEEAFRLDPGSLADYEALLRELGAPPSRVLHLWSCTDAEPDFAAAQAGGLVSVTLLAQALAAVHGGAAVHLVVAGNGLCQVLDGDAVHPGKATLLGGLKVIRQEVPRLDVAIVDVAPPPAGQAGSAAAARLVEQLLAEAAALASRAPSNLPADGASPEQPAAPPPHLPPLPIVALRGRQRFVRGSERLHLPDAGPRPDQAGSGAGLLRGGAYLIAGADRGAGEPLAQHLVRQLDARVALVIAPAAAAAAPAESPAAGRLLTLAGEVGDTRVLIVRGDPADPAVMAAAAAQAGARFGALHGALWSGGVATGLLPWKTAAGLHAALDQVAREAAALCDAAAPAAPRFVALLATTAAVTGGVGLLEEAAAGSYLEAFANQRASGDGVAEAVPPCPVVAVHWDPYQWGGWLVAELGAGTAGLSPLEMAAMVAEQGIAPERSAGALGLLLAAALPAAAISAGDLALLASEADSVTADALLAGMAAPGVRSPRPDLATPYEAPRDELEESLAALWQELFGIEPIGRDDVFLDLGGHSLLAIQIVTQVRHRLHVDLPLTVLFEAPTVAQLAAAVRRARGEDDPAELEALLAQVEALSAAEAADKLAQLDVPAEVPAGVEA